MRRIPLTSSFSTVALGTRQTPILLWEGEHKWWERLGSTGLNAWEVRFGC